MSLRWLILLAATIVMVLPLPAFYRSTHRFRSLHELDIERRNGSWWLTWRQVLRFPGHWIEVARGLLAGYGMVATVDEVHLLSPLYQTHAAWARFVLPLACATLGVALIAGLSRQHHKSVAPIPFVAATMLVLLPPQVALPALFLAASGGFALRSLAAFFGILAPSLILIGLLLDRLIWPSLAGAILAFTPLLFALGLNHEFVIPVRRPRSGT